MRERQGPGEWSGCHREAGPMVVKDGFNNLALGELSHLEGRVQDHGKRLLHL